MAYGQPGQWPSPAAVGNVLFVSTGAPSEILRVHHHFQGYPTDTGGLTSKVQDVSSPGMYRCTYKLRSSAYLPRRLGKIVLKRCFRKQRLALRGPFLNREIW